MSIPSSARKVHLVDGRTSARPFVEAIVYRDYSPTQLEVIEALWGAARENAAAGGAAEGLAPLEHDHWDWRNKADSVRTGQHLLVAAECEGEPQGVMAVFRAPRRARLGDGHVVYVDYVETAPWNLKGMGAAPRFLGVGSVLLTEAVRLSLEMRLEGRVGLHSLPQAEGFYERCGMTRVGPDPTYYDLAYFEFTGQQAAAWLATTGGAQ